MDIGVHRTSLVYFSVPLTGDGGSELWMPALVEGTLAIRSAFFLAVVERSHGRLEESSGVCIVLVFISRDAFKINADISWCF